MATAEKWTWVRCEEDGSHSEHCGDDEALATEIDDLGCPVVCFIYREGVRVSGIEAHNELFPG